MYIYPILNSTIFVGRYTSVPFDPMGSSVFFCCGNRFLGGGFNPFEKFLSNWMISTGRGENKKYLKPPPSFCCQMNVKQILTTEKSENESLRCAD